MKLVDEWALTETLKQSEQEITNAQLIKRQKFYYAEVDAWGKILDHVRQLHEGPLFEIIVKAYGMILLERPTGGYPHAEANEKAKAAVLAAWRTGRIF